MDSPPQLQPRIALLYPARDPQSPSNWSGSPRGISDGLRTQGVDLVTVGTPTSFGVGRGQLGALRALSSFRGSSTPFGRPEVALRSKVMARQLRSVGAFDGLVAMATDLYSLEVVRLSSIPTVTYDDGTLAQQWANADSDIRRAGLASEHVDRRIGTQKASSRAADRCCVSTGWAAASFVDDYGIPASSVDIVGMGHRPRAHRTAARDWSRPRFLFVGVDWRRKNGEQVLRAFADVYDRHPDSTLDVVGEHPQLAQPGVTGHGLLPRHDATAQTHLDRLFSAATVFVMPSRFDPSPIAYLEAASAGLPVIGTTEGGAAELLGPAGRYVRPDDTTALVEAMMEMTDPATAAQMGSEGQARSSAYSWSAVGARVVRSLQLAGGHPHPAPAPASP